jgi:predicted HD superfamily hydrolase involved in NAD metabolism
LNNTVFIDELTSFLKQHISAERFAHSISVAQTMLELSRHYHYPHLDKAYIAGLAHDIAREYPLVKIKEIALKHQRYTKLDEKFPIVLHGHIAAIIVQKYLGFYDAEIDDAMRWHTTGHSHMEFLAQLLYVADFIEPLRQHMKSRTLVWNQFFTIKDFVCFVLGESISYYQIHHMPVHPITWQLYDDFFKKNDKNI